MGSVIKEQNKINLCQTKGFENVFCLYFRVRRVCDNSMVWDLLVPDETLLILFRLCFGNTSSSHSPAVCASFSLSLSPQTLPCSLLFCFFDTAIGATFTRYWSVFFFPSFTLSIPLSSSRFAEVPSQQCWCTLTPHEQPSSAWCLPVVALSIIFGLHPIFKLSLKEKNVTVF